MLPAALKYPSGDLNGFCVYRPARGGRLCEHALWWIQDYRPNTFKRFFHLDNLSYQVLWLKGIHFFKIKHLWPITYFWHISQPKFDFYIRKKLVYYTGCLILLVPSLISSVSYYSQVLPNFSILNPRMLKSSLRNWHLYMILSMVIWKRSVKEALFHYMLFKKMEIFYEYHNYHNIYVASYCSRLCNKW